MSTFGIVAAMMISEAMTQRMLYRKSIWFVADQIRFAHRLQYHFRRRRMHRKFIVRNELKNLNVCKDISGIIETFL